MRFRERQPLAARVMVGVALAVLALACLWAGPWAFAVLVAVTAALAWREWARMYKVAREPDQVVSVAISLIIISAAAFDFSGIALFVATLVIYLNWHTNRQVHSHFSFFARMTFLNKRTVGENGLLYILTPALSLVWLDARPGGERWIEYTVGIVAAADIAAFACGRLIGGPKLWPALSPAKTWAGFIGACLAAAAASALLAQPLGFAPVRAAVAGLALGALAVGGDLFESWIKRRAGVKDSGSILPGHGGVLDRLDGLIPVAVVVAGGVWVAGL